MPPPLAASLPRTTAFRRITGRSAIMAPPPAPAEFSSSRQLLTGKVAASNHEGPSVRACRIPHEVTIVNASVFPEKQQTTTRARGAGSSSSNDAAHTDDADT